MGLKLSNRSISALFDLFRVVSTKMIVMQVEKIMHSLDCLKYVDIQNRVDSWLDRKVKVSKTTGKCVNCNS